MDNGEPTRTENRLRSEQCELEVSHAWGAFEDGTRREWITVRKEDLCLIPHGVDKNRTSAICVLAIFLTATRDEARFLGKWAFFNVGSETKAVLIPQTAKCHSCHLDHSVIDASIVLCHPALLPIAQKKGTLSAN
jgi:hypothetical protein